MAQDHWKPQCDDGEHDWQYNDDAGRPFTARVGEMSYPLKWGICRECGAREWDDPTVWVFCG